MKPRHRIEKELKSLGATDIVLTYRNQWYYMDGCPRWEATLTYEGSRVSIEGIGDDSESAADDLVDTLTEDIETGFIHECEDS